MECLILIFFHEVYNLDNGSQWRQIESFDAIQGVTTAWFLKLTINHKIAKNMSRIQGLDALPPFWDGHECQKFLGENALRPPKQYGHASEKTSS